MPMTREQLLQVQASARVYQTRADEAFEPWGMRAPAPVLGEDPDDYRRKLMILAKNQLPESHELRKITVKRIPNDALDNFEKMYYDACRDAGTRNDSVPPGEMRMVPSAPLFPPAARGQLRLYGPPARAFYPNGALKV